jgi:hypothetical protein
MRRSTKEGGGVASMGSWIPSSFAPVAQALRLVLDLDGAPRLCRQYDAQRPFAVGAMQAGATASMNAG